MTAYYPSQASYGGHSHGHGHHHGGQPVMYASSGYPSAYGAPAGGVMYVPSSPQSQFYDYDYDEDPYYYPHRRSRSYSRHHGSYYEQYPYSYPSYYSGVPQVMSTAGPAVVLQPSHSGYGHGYHGQWTFGQRVRRFFGLAPTPAFKYKSDRNTWGFLGYSRRQRYTDPRTGMEVDREGRPVIRT